MFTHNWILNETMDYEEISVEISKRYNIVEKSLIMTNDSNNEQQNAMIEGFQVDQEVILKDYEEFEQLR